MQLHLQYHFSILQVTQKNITKEEEGDDEKEKNKDKNKNSNESSSSSSHSKSSSLSHFSLSQGNKTDKETKNTKDEN
ncbi:hypothetical protein M0813_10786 [Anaeramoeba flamelloides]|uniref:Uncharacterized protein n=1 Tax=Anaeramoeba flamelloides TaxID=1746091 RepID=A0ABQ8X1Y8_9EUKA|nr:hypothetical protein M0813_10786 [Anaeramoeba flamelloides]